MFCKSFLNLGNNCFYLVSRVMNSDSSLWGRTETTEISDPLKVSTTVIFSFVSRNLMSDRWNTMFTKKGLNSIYTDLESSLEGWRVASFLCFIADVLPDIRKPHSRPLKEQSHSFIHIKKVFIHATISTLPVVGVYRIHVSYELGTEV